jgi:hypothetical protein
MTKTNDGGFALAGNYLVKVDDAGNQQWTIGLSGQPGCVIQTRDGGYALSGCVGVNTTSVVPRLTKIDVTNSNQTSQPSNSPSTTPTPTVPEFSWLAILPLFLSLLFVAVIFRHRKTLKLNQRKR